MQKKIETEQAPRAIGPYSQAVEVELKGESILFVSGQLPIDPKTGKLVEGGIDDLTRQVIMNISNILKANGLSLSQVVRTDVFLKDLNKDFQLMNAEYAKHFQGPVPPARQTIQVADLPLGAPVEISCIAVKS